MDSLTVTWERYICILIRTLMGRGGFMCCAVNYAYNKRICLPCSLDISWWSYSKMLTIDPQDLTFVSLNLFLYYTPYYVIWAVRYRQTVVVCSNSTTNVMTSFNCQSARSAFYMMTSSNGNISCVTGLCTGNSPVTGDFAAQRPVTRSFDFFFDLHPNKWLSKQSWGWLF